MPFSPVVVVLAAISVVGAIAIPFGDPQFIDRAIALELSFIALTVLIYKGFRKALYACIPLAAIVMIGNSLAPPHVEIMTTFSKPFNAVLLIIGGYILQVALIATAVRELRIHQKMMKKAS
jgi:asparagine N-glycosylation enzyme membrane subunit Stt3